MPPAIKKPGLLEPNKEPLHIKYRPANLDDVIGQDAAVASLRRLFTDNRVPHCFLFTGASGCGKTTLARIVGTRMECEVVELDAARYSGIDQMRELLGGGQYASLADNGRKMFVIDEAHALSKASWQTLLKSTEDPPAHLYFCLCTTEPDKVPNTIRTRSHAYDLKPVKWDMLAEYLEWVAEQEGCKLQNKEFYGIAARQSNGSPRQALVYLSMLHGITSKEDALRIVEDFEEQTGGPVELARLLVSNKGCTWPNVQQIMEGIADINPETIRLTVLNYTAGAIAKEKGEKNAVRLLALLQAFSVPCNPTERMAPIYLAIGSFIFS